MAGRDGRRHGSHARHSRRGISRRFEGIHSGGRSALVAFLPVRIGAATGPGFVANL
ncbi:MAG: hypothetical protein ACOVRM_13905 [Planctomycetaceae bacterium]|jgi:hypothetical protein